MDLLLELKRLFQDLEEDGTIKEMPKLEELERLADKCVEGHYKDIDKFLVPILKPEKYDKYKERINKIKEISKREKKL